MYRAGVSVRWGAAGNSLGPAGLSECLLLHVFIGGQARTLFEGASATSFGGYLSL